MKGLFNALKSKRGSRHDSETGGFPAESAPVRHAPSTAVAAANVLPAVPGAVHRHLGTPQNGPNSFRLPVEPAATADGDSPTALSRPQLLTESNVARSANGYQRVGGSPTHYPAGRSEQVSKSSIHSQSCILGGCLPSQRLKCQSLADAMRMG